MKSHLSGFRGFCFQEYPFSLYSLRFQGEFCRYGEGFYLCFVGLSRSTYKLCGKHGRTKKSSHPCGCCEFAGGRIIRLISGLSKPSLSFSRGTFSEEKLRGFLVFLLTSLVRFLAGLFGVVPLATSTSLRRWRLHWTIEIYEVKHSVIKASYHCWAFCSFGKNNYQNTFENNHFERTETWSRHSHTQHWYVTKFQSTSIA